MKVKHVILSTLLTAAPIMGQATIIGNSEIKIDFTNARDAASKAKWSTPDKIFISTNGLGWEGQANESRDGWIQTEPLAIGESWRTPESMYVRVSIHPSPKELKLGNGEHYTPDPGAVYVRYSPDLAHWSSWQVLQSAVPQSIEEKKDPGVLRDGMISVTSRDRERFYELLSEYSRTDVPWGSDEEAAVIWILKSDPDFFSKQIPFIGYVQLLYEVQFHGNNKVRSFNAEISWGMGGLAQIPKDPKANKNRNVPWRLTSKH